MAAEVTTLHRVDLRLVIRHLLGDPESACDRIGARHRRTLVLYCAGWCHGRAFAGVIADPLGRPRITPFGTASEGLSAEIWRSVRLRALRATPTAVWHHPFPLETAADYAAQHDALLAHLREHATGAGWTADAPDEAVRPGADPRVAGAAFSLHPPRDLPAWTSPRWSPDPDEPPRHVRVFPGYLDYRGQRYTVTDREAVDPRDGRLLTAFRRDAGGELWLNEQGRIVASIRPTGLRDSSP